MGGGPQLRPVLARGTCPILPLSDVPLLVPFEQGPEIQDRKSRTGTGVGGFILHVHFLQLSSVSDAGRAVADVPGRHVEFSTPETFPTARRCWDGPLETPAALTLVVLVQIAICNGHVAALN